MSVEQYWMGKGLDLDRLWQDFDDGNGYINKVGASELHLLRLIFAYHPSNLPLFDHEVIYKTVKGTFHDVKAACFTPAAYDEAAPIFLYRVERGSGIFEFLAQFDPLMTWVVALGGAAMFYRKVLAADQELDEKRLAFLRSNFPRASTADVRAYLKAWTTFGRRRVLHRLIEQGLHRVEVSRVPLTSEAIGQPPDMVDMAGVVPLIESAAL
jgi:hypothetical protein